MSDKQGWTSGPQTRGSFDILWTCLATLALCVWTAVHPNILRVPSYRHALLSRLGMMLIAIVFPEFIISAAWSQLRSSRALRANVNALYQDAAFKGQTQRINDNHRSQTDDQEYRQVLLPPLEFDSFSEDVSSLHCRETSHSISAVGGEALAVENKRDNERKRETMNWSSEQAFFAVMGGFAIENDYIDNETNAKVVLRRLVTMEGVLQLAQLRLIPPITPEDIEERSKADIIAKTFVLSQIIWFGLQVIGRLASQIPVTPLETHTAIHVACTVVIYLMWLKKPYDVRSSVLLSDTNAKDMGALFHFSKITTQLYAQTYSEYQDARVSYWKDRVVRAASNLLDYEPPPTPPVKEALTAAVERYLLLRSDETLATPKYAQEQILVALAPAAMRGIQKLKSREGFSSDSVDSQSWDFLRETSENFMMRAVWGGWSTDTGHEMSLDKGVHFLFNFLYGGGHLAAWNSSSFPTLVEQWIWRGSAIMLTLVPVWGSLWILWWKAAISKRRELYLFRNGDLDIIVAPFFFIVILAYFCARSYLLVESLISLRLLPPGAFLTVNWTRYLPHIS